MCVVSFIFFYYYCSKSFAAEPLGPIEPRLRTTDLHTMIVIQWHRPISVAPKGECQINKY